ncbi:MAG: Uma2 family endonuclease [Chloroflexota bacterium]
MTVQLQPKTHNRFPSPQLFFNFMPDQKTVPDAPTDKEQTELEFVTKEEEVIYGWREVYETDANGNTTRTLVTLTLEDFLHPQEGDMHVQNRSHNKIGSYVETAMHVHLSHIPDRGIYGDVGIDWGVHGEGYYAPDVSVFYNVRNPNKPLGIFYVVEEGTAPSLVLEVTSPTTRHVDFGEKYEAYERLGVPCYIIVDTAGYDENGDEIFQLLGYDFTPNGFVEITPNEQGWLWMAPVSAWIGLHENQVRCYDALGNYIRRPEEEVAVRVEAEQRAEEEATARAEAERQAEEEATARAEAERQVAEAAAARAEAERQAEAEATARAEAERQVAEEAAARAEAERQAEAEAAARAEAERRTEDEVNARRLLEEQIAALQAQLQKQQ